MNFHENFKFLRESKGTYQKELAFYLNVSIGTISNYEQGVHSPDLQTLCKIATFFGVSTDYLLGRTKFKYSPSIIERRVTKEVRVSDLLHLLTRLSKKDIFSLLDYLSLLELRMSQKPKD